MRNAVETGGEAGTGAHGRAYAMFVLNMLLSFITMYLVMFAMIDTVADFHNNLNTAYMALAMVAPMGAVMLATMPGMYSDRRVNLLLYGGLGALFILALAGIRTQALVGDRQFIDSMIPHHSGAILMCREAYLSDAELQILCSEIEAAQRAEIAQMKAIRARLQ